MGKEAEELEREAAEAAEEAEEAAAEAAADEAADDEDDADGDVDKHGHPSVSKGKYARDMKAKDDKIAELESKLEDAHKTEEGREALQKQIADLKEQMASDKVTHALELAGCKSVKAAKALLGDVDNDIDELFDYQSECHCSKTEIQKFVPVFLFDYQSECHCSKTEN